MRLIRCDKCGAEVPTTGYLRFEMVPLRECADDLNHAIWLKDAPELGEGIKRPARIEICGPCAFNLAVEFGLAKPEEIPPRTRNGEGAHGAVAAALERTVELTQQMAGLIERIDQGLKKLPLWMPDGSKVEL